MEEGSHGVGATAEGLTRLDGSPGTPRKAAVSCDGSGFRPDDEGCSAGRGRVLFVTAEEVSWPGSEAAREPFSGAICSILLFSAPKATPRKAACDEYRSSAARWMRFSAHRPWM